MYTASYKKLLNTPETIGTRAVAFELFKRFVWSEAVSIMESYISNEISVTYGVPQGTVLGPVLFTMSTASSI